MHRNQCLIDQIQQACRTSSLEKADLRWLMRSPLRTVLNYSGAVVQLQVDAMPTHVIGFDIAPRLIRALRVAAHLYERGNCLRQVHANRPFLFHVDALRALPLGPHLRPLAQGHLVVHGYADADQVLRSVYAFIGIHVMNWEEFQRTLKLITPSLHHVFVAAYQTRRPGLPALTRAEREICRILMNGASNKQIANMLNKSAATVRNQLHVIFAKLGVSTRSAAATLLRELQPALTRNTTSIRATSSVEHLYY